MWRLLDRDSLLLLAPRRIGKTSPMRKLCAEAGDQGLRAFSLSFAACPDELACVRELSKALAAAEPTLVKSVQGTLKGLLPSIRSLKLGRPLGIELAAGETADWRALGEALARSIGDLDGRWLIAVDEVPVFLLGLLKRNDGLERVRGFLYWWRDLRQQHHADIRWILAGSIGLDTVPARHGIGDTVNDLVPAPLGAFDSETSDRFLAALAADEGIKLTKPVRKAIIEAIGWPVPYSTCRSYSTAYGTGSKSAQSPRPFWSSRSSRSCWSLPTRATSTTGASVSTTSWAAQRTTKPCTCSASALAIPPVRAAILCPKPWPSTSGTPSRARSACAICSRYWRATAIW
jgi:hypothetical protein